MFVRFQPADTPSGTPPENPDPAAVTVPRVERPLSVVTVPDRAMQPELHPGQQVLVQNFDTRGGANYLEQRMAVRAHGRVLVRRLQHMADGSIRLFGNAGGFEHTLVRPEEWELPADWKQTGVVHPNCTVLGPLVYAYRSRQGGRDTYLATVGWSN
jgi:hypothetical protein